MDHQQKNRVKKKGVYSGLIHDIKKGQNGSHYAIAYSSEVDGRIEFPLEKPAWVERDRPALGTAVMIFNLIRDRVGWHALRVSIL